MKSFFGIIVFFFSFYLSFAQIKKTLRPEDDGNEKNKSDTTDFFNRFTFGHDTLFITTHFSECGEWGGHNEISKIYLKGDSYYIDYRKFEVDCNTVGRNGGHPIQKLVQNVNKILFDTDKLAIRHYVHQILDSKFWEPVCGNAACEYRIYNLDLSLNICVYGLHGGEPKVEYLELVKKIME